mmetsp:Transcript_1933/g.6913  ORF Transcript_1933/g.6913 Transcript_1933/m.6913 type:complete len:233 (-) Transcript_1933:668-1366(-)
MHRHPTARRIGCWWRSREWFGAERVFGVVAYACINRLSAGEVDHIDYGHLVIGHAGRDEKELARAVQMWDGSDVDVQPTPDILLARWRKAMWNIPFNGLAVTAGCLSTGRIMGNPELRAAARALMLEVAAAARADLAARAENGGGPPPLAEDGGPAPSEQECEAMLVFTEMMNDYRPSTMLDFAAGREMEWETIFLAPLLRARRLGKACPLLALLTAQIQALDMKRLEGVRP